MRNPFRKIVVREIHICNCCGDREVKTYTTTPARYWLTQNWSMIIGYQLFIGYLVGIRVYDLIRGSPKVFKGVFCGLVGFAVAYIIAYTVLIYVPEVMIAQCVLAILTALSQFVRFTKEEGESERQYMEKNR